MPFGWAAAATVASAGIGLVSSSMQADATADAQDSANAVQREAMDEQRAAREQSRADLQPWVGAGRNALNMTGDLSGSNGPDAATAAMKNYVPSPGYQWQLGEGLRAIDAGAAAKGMLRSGATLKAETAYGQGLASQDFGNYYNRLYNLSNQGQNSAAGQASASLKTGEGIAQTNTSAGAAQADIYGNAAQGVGNSINQYQNNSLYQQRTNALNNGSVGGGNGGTMLSAPGSYGPGF